MNIFANLLLAILSNTAVQINMLKGISHVCLTEQYVFTF